MSRKSAALGAASRAALERRQRDRRVPALTGYQRSDGSVSLRGDSAHDDTLLVSQMYVRPYGDPKALEIAYCDGFGNALNYPVLIEQFVDGWHFVGTNGALINNEQQPLSSLPPGTLPLWVLVDPRSVDEGRLRNTLDSPNSLVVTVSPFDYTDSAGTPDVTFDAENTSTLTFTPPSAIGGLNAHVYIRLSLDPDAATPALVQTPGTPIYSTIPLTLADSDAIVTPTGNLPLWDVPFTTGDTAPPDPSLWIDRRPWLSSGGGGGSTSPLTTKGDIWGYSTLNARIPVGANGKVLTANSADALGVDWETPVGFTAAGDTGTPQTISPGDTLTQAGGSGISTVASATDTITTNLDINKLTEDTAPDAAADFVATYDVSATANKKVKLVNLPAGGAASVLNVNTTAVGNVGAGEDNLITYAMPGGTLANNTDYLHIVASVQFGASLNNKTLKVYFGSTVIYTTGVLAITAATDAVVEAWVIRTGAATQVCYALLTSSSATLSASAQYTTATETLSGAVTVKLTGTGTADNDIVERTLTIEKYAGTITTASSIPVDGWTAAGETWTYSSIDDPTSVFAVSGDVTGKYSLGMKIKFTQSTGGTKYFFITKLAFAAATTTVSCYGGTDYDIANETISSPYWSVAKAPYGFPLDPAKWTVSVHDGSDYTQSSPAQNTFYSLGLDIVVPIGCWYMSFNAICKYVKNSTTTTDALFALSTSTSGISHDNLRSRQDFVVGSANLSIAFSQAAYSEPVSFTAKTTMHLLIRTNLASVGSLVINGAAQASQLQAICAYL